MPNAPKVQHAGWTAKGKFTTDARRIVPGRRRWLVTFKDGRVVHAGDMNAAAYVMGLDDVQYEFGGLRGNAIVRLTTKIASAVAVSE